MSESSPLTNTRYISGWVERSPLTNMRDTSSWVESMALHYAVLFLFAIHFSKNKDTNAYALFLLWNKVGNANALL